MNEGGGETCKRERRKLADEGKEEEEKEKRWGETKGGKKRTKIR